MSKPSGSAKKPSGSAVRQGNLEAWAMDPSRAETFDGLFERHHSTCSTLKVSETLVGYRWQHKQAQQQRQEALWERLQEGV